MAKQHFYSRVPSKVSIFYKSNGFDTFAMSEGITQEFIEKELNFLLEQKLTTDELALIRINKLDPIYCHFSTKSGTFIENCISFFSSDYTGERSTYLVHSLIFDEKEEKVVHNNTKYKTINKDLFLNDMSCFNITSPNAKGIKDYEELTFKKKELDEPITWLSNLDQQLLKNLIFATFASVFGKYKSIYLILPDESLEYTLKFFNSYIQLFPYHLRKHISFVSKVLDFNKYPGFTIKVINSSLGQAPLSKGVTIDFKSKMVFGIKENDFKLLQNVPSFIHRLINHDIERIAFFDFVKRAVDKIDLLGTLDFKVTIDLVFLFLCSSGLYDENVGLKDDDSILGYLNIYAKYREALSDEYRMNALKALRRYPNNYLAIPKTIFSQLSKIYSTEISGTKYIIMNVMLDLIHTDLMRPQLFNFIKNNYDRENNDSKSSIVRNLAKVFYGGFLQEEIIAFYKTYFNKFNDEDRIIVLDKLFQSVRTSEIQDSLFNFVNDLYDKFTIEEKKMFYSMAIEHYPEGDELAKRLLDLCDVHIISETDDLTKFYVKQLKSILSDEQKRKGQLLLSIVSESNGFTYDVVTSVVFNEWRKRKIAIEFISLSCRGSLTDRVDKIIKMWEPVKRDIEDDLSKKFIESVILGFEKYPIACKLDEIFLCEEKLIEGLKKVKKKYSNAFITRFKNEIIDILIRDSLMSVFDSQEKDAVEKVIDYAKDNELIVNCDKYEFLIKYVELKNAIKNEDILLVINSLVGLSHQKFSFKFADYLKNDLKKETEDNLNIKLEDLLLQLVIDYLKTNKTNLNSLYNKYYNIINDKFGDEKNNKLEKQLEICKLYYLLIHIADAIDAIEDGSEYITKIKEELIDYDNGVIQPSNDIVINYGAKQLKLILENGEYKNSNINKYIITQTKKTKSKAGLFAKVVKPWI